MKSILSIEKNKSFNEKNYLLDLSWAQWTFLLTSRALGSSKRPHSSSSSIRHLPEKISFESLYLILNIARILDPKSKRLNSSLSSIPHMPQKPSFESLISRDIGTKVQKAQNTNTRSDLQKYWRQNKTLFLLKLLCSSSKKGLIVDVGILFCTSCKWSTMFDLNVFIGFRTVWWCFEAEV